MRTKSKNFNDSQVIGILPDGSIYLKMGVCKKRYNDALDYDDMSHINEKLINSEAINKFYLLTGTSPITEEE
jgi:hypothetical protein